LVQRRVMLVQRRVICVVANTRHLSTDELEFYYQIDDLAKIKS
jgi:hypothetical protein